jgi:hypothetical protein
MAAVTPSAPINPIRRATRFDRYANQTQTPTPTTFNNLPLQVIEAIADNASPQTQAALKTTTKDLHGTLSNPYMTLVQRCVDLMVGQRVAPGLLKFMASTGASVAGSSVLRAILLLLLGK